MYNNRTIKEIVGVGMKFETADMHHFKQSGEFSVHLGFFIDSYQNIPNWYQPAWSLHRLIEIAMKGDKLGCITHNIHLNNVSSYYELVIASIEHLIKIDEFNKDYLEEK